MPLFGPKLAINQSQIKCFKEMGTIGIQVTGSNCLKTSQPPGLLGSLQYESYFM